MSNTSLLGSYGGLGNAGLQFRNKLINGNFDIWQRGTPFTQNTGSGYSADRWYHRVGNVPGILSKQNNDFSAFSSKHFYRMDNNTASSNSDIWLKQRIEDVVTLAGDTATLSFWAKASSTKTISVHLNQNFGSGGSAEVSNIGVTNIDLTTAWKKFTVSFSVPSIAGKTVGDSSYLELFFNLSSFVNTAFEFDIAQVQLEAGPVATPFEHRPIGLELSLCERYYEVIVITPTYISGLNTAYLILTYPFKTKKRASGGAVSVSGWSYYSGGTGVSITGPSYVNATEDSVGLGKSGLTNGSGFQSGTIYVDAEL